MTVKELITYLLNFNMGAEIIFVDKDGIENHVTNNSRDYLGEGKYADNGKVKFITIEKKTK